MDSYYVLPLRSASVPGGTLSPHTWRSPPHGSKKSLSIAVGYDVSQKYSCATLILSVSAGE